MCHKMADEMEEQVGDSSKNVLANYQRCARELLRSALVEQFGGTTVSTCWRERSLEQAQLLERKKKLVKKQLEAAVELELRRQLSEEPLGSVSISEDEAYVDSARLRLKVLEEELLKVKSKHTQDSRLLECLHCGKALREKVFGDDENTDDVTKCPSDSDTTSQLMKLSELSGQLVKEVEEIDEMKRELTRLRKERLKVHQQSRVIMEAVQSSKRPHSSQCSIDDRSEENSSLSDSSSQRVDNAENEVCLLRHTLQALIAGSGVIWSQDKELLQLTLQLGDNEQWT